MPLKTFEDLDVWKRGCRLAVDTYVATNDSKDFKLNSQMQRAAVSIPSNVAEGSERDSDKDFARFLRMSKGSCGELRTQLYISRAVRKELSQSELPNSSNLIEETKEISAMLQGLINSLSAK